MLIGNTTIIKTKKMSRKLLYNAIIRNDYNQVELLLKKKNINLNRSVFLKKPYLHIKNTIPSIIILLLKHGADPNIKYKGKTPLMIHDNIQVIKILIEYNADLDIQDKDGNTAMMIHRNPEIIKILAINGADPNIQNKYGKTVLLIKGIRICKIIINNSKIPINPNIYDNCGVVILMRMEDINSIKKLIDMGADPNIMNKYGTTSLLLVRGKNDEIITRDYNVLKYLLENGADPTILNHHDKYPHYYYNKIGKLRECKLIDEHVKRRENDNMNQIEKKIIYTRQNNNRNRFIDKIKNLISSPNRYMFDYSLINCDII